MERPDLIIGIDFGMTCTGVSYVNLAAGGSPTYIYKWPGRSQASEYKVPTKIVYPKGFNQPSSWGFSAETRSEQYGDDKIYCDWFKEWLDPQTLQLAQAKGPEDAPRSQQEVDKWFEDYMGLLYRHIEFKLGAELPSTKSWETAKIEFLFSVPTTWPPSGPTVEKFKRLVQQAGYERPNHSISVGLTEAEAAAVATSIETPGLFHENDILLTCDAGGGTTDLSVQRITGTTGSLSLQQMDSVFGRSIGSTTIDSDFEDLALERLKAANRVRPLGIDLIDTAWALAKSREYQNAKCDFGSPDDTPIFSVPVVGLSATYANRQYGIENGAMIFSHQDLQRLFDKQVQAMCLLIDEQLKKFENKNPGQQIAHLILSGGLGSSAYVQSQLRSRFGLGLSSFYSAKNLQIQVAQLPQLVVCKGLVLDRKVKVERGRAVLGWRCCRESYGTIAKLRYNKKDPHHFGKPLARDPQDGKWYIADGIVWFIKKGDPVNVDVPITHQFRRKMTPGNPLKVFADNVVTSDVDKELLPINIDADVRKLCELKSDLSSIEDFRFKKKNRHWWQFRQVYLRADYQIRLVIGPADIRFQLWFEGQQLSKDNSISVQWEASAPPDQMSPTTEESVFVGNVNGGYMTGLRHLGNV